LSSAVRLAAATAASTALVSPRVAGTAATASCTAVCTMAIRRTAGGVPIFASITYCPARVFQSVTASACAVAAGPAASAQASINRLSRFMVAP
jgi:hypothetical protein